MASFDGWLECVPNVSEGRRPEVIGRLAAAVDLPGVRLLDLSSDADHDRTVLTLAGAPAALHEALLALVERSIETIDLSRPLAAAAALPGVHPRMGAVDVVPFVPLGETPMATAIAAAEALGGAVAERFGLPVFLYEEAARQSDRRNLATVRRGGFEGLAGRLADPAWTPDFGPSRPHPTAGAVAIGARTFLVAFNVVLDTAEVGLAREVARAVRESSGGLPGVKAIGVPLASRDRVQVSMNLVDLRRTSPWTALEAVRAEAAARGARILESELVGLMPEDAAWTSLAEALRLAGGFGASRTIEGRLREGQGEEGVTTSTG